MTEGSSAAPGGGARMAALIRRALSAVMAALVFAMMGLTTVDVGARYLFAAPLPGGFEIMQFMMALLIFSALPLVTWNDGHIVVSIFEGWFRGRLRYVQRTFVLVVSAGTVGLISWRMWHQGDVLAEGQQITGFLEWPIAPLAYVMSGLGAVTLVVLLAMIWQHLRDAAGPAARPEDTV